MKYKFLTHVYSTQYIFHQFGILVIIVFHIALNDLLCEGVHISVTFQIAGDHLNASKGKHAIDSIFDREFTLRCAGSWIGLR